MEKRESRRLKVLVLNPKGGSGKTTLATNLAAWYANNGLEPALTDLDPQGSSMRWINRRGDDLPPVHGIKGFDLPGNVTRSFALEPPFTTRRVIVDTPASLPSSELVRITRDADRILIPVLPSHIDIHAVTRCIADLLLVAKIPRAENRIAIVANRVKRNTIVFRSLMRFLATLKIPVAGVLRDSQNYVRAYEGGRGVHELHGRDRARDVDQWRTLLEWLEEDRIPAVCDLWEDPKLQLQ